MLSLNTNRKLGFGNEKREIDRGKLLRWSSKVALGFSTTFTLSITPDLYETSLSPNLANRLSTPSSHLSNADRGPGRGKEWLLRPG